MPPLKYGHLEFWAASPAPTDPLQLLRESRWTGPTPAANRKPLCDRTLRLGPLEMQVRAWWGSRRA